MSATACRILLACLLVAVPASSTTLVAQAPVSWEARFRAVPEAGRIGEYMRLLSARPHHVGSPYDRQNAEWMLARFKEWGWDARIESYDVLFPTPKERLVEMIAPVAFTATLDEPAVPQDPTSNQKSEQLPSYNAYSADGDVTAPLVYVNYGRPSDYDELDRRGISVKGAIVIARYGQSWRGIKPKVAAEHGAVGCLIYSDPRDDGYFDGEVFPEGPMRNRNGVQRGSVMDMSAHPGDPLTPGIAAKPGARRLALADVETITKIPVLPISYGDAQPLLAALTGPVAPEEWRGALPLTYRIGPGASRVHLKVRSNWDQQRLYNVIATLRGSTFPDEWIIRGNHHDAWVNGASDPLSGMSAMLEEARALGALTKQGWQPKRTIVYTAWDGEEPMLLGSTEWVEDHEAELREKAVVYINTDNSGRGFLGASGSHTLEHLVNDIARDIEDPDTKLSVWQRMKAARIANGSSTRRTEARTRADLRIGALGSGSDYSAFLQHAGVATLDLGFGGQDPSGVYHSVYDDFYHFTHFIDTDFMYCRALAQTAGSLVVRMADADVLPFAFTNLADTVHTYLTELKTLLSERQEAAKERNREIEEGVFVATADRKAPVKLPTIEEVPPAINFAPLDNAVTALTTAAARYQKAVAAAGTPGDAAVRRTNALLIQSERQLLDPDGLPRRAWYRHLLYAPGNYTGYAVKTIPGVREAIEDRRYTEAEREIVRAAQALDRETALIENAAAGLEPSR